jgi:hypothetical protein
VRVNEIDEALVNYLIQRVEGVNIAAKNLRRCDLMMVFAIFSTVP